MLGTETTIAELQTEPGRAGRPGVAAAGDLSARLAALATCSYDDLRAEWRRVYRSHPPKKLSRDLLELGVAWKVQEKVLGGLGPALKRRVAGLAEIMAREGDLAQTRTVTIRPGARLVREWKGKIHEVLVVEEGFQWQGEHWRSLTAIAGAITGTHWSGPRFFGLGGARKSDGGKSPGDDAVSARGGDSVVGPEPPRRRRSGGADAGGASASITGSVPLASSMGAAHG